MPYLAHFALAVHPFGLTPNTEQYFPTANNTHILQSLQYATAKRGGILKVVGDVGTGKTMLCRLLLRTLMDNPDTRGGVAYLNAPQADGEWLLAALCIEFGLEGGGNRAELMNRLNQFLVAAHAEGRTCVVVVDEAQALGVQGLETIRLLSNLETETAKLLQIVLFGQPELDVLLARPDLRQINQRIVFAFNTQPLSEPEVTAYVQHRLRCARVPGVEFPVFTPTALAGLARASQGVPRVVNILADKALMIAYGDNAMPVTEAHVGKAVADSRAIVGALPKPRRRSGWGRRLLWGSVAVEAAVIAAILVVNPDLPRRALMLLTDDEGGITEGVAAPAAPPEAAVPAAPPEAAAPAVRPEVAAPAVPVIAPSPSSQQSPASVAEAVEPVPVPPVVPSSLPAVLSDPPPVAAPVAEPAPTAALPPAPAGSASSVGAVPSRTVVPVPIAKPAALSQPAISSTTGSAEGAATTRREVVNDARREDGTVVGRRMPDGSWRWE